MGRKKKKHIFLYDPEVQKTIEELRKMFPDLTYDEIFGEFLKIPESDIVLGDRFFKLVEAMNRRYKDPKIKLLAGYLWIMLLKAAKGEYDINKLLYNLDPDKLKIEYKKR